ncbi:basic helix-loop-helix DNA-binding superfamily protein [Prunus dulcis]|uniref:Basic helix-loop-helix DNA-binding superfamily protein n=1 Tax=Prunus dulcis TaxID=3755 RepID=A0A4Y1RA12_PRUDU|nr:basic helix-loop-helix DNA-binding superfamily protein [Prunus dulcis]
MAEEFQAGICGSSWWNTSRHALVASPCSVGFNDHIGSFGCPNDMVDMKASRSSCGEINNSVSDHDDDHQHTNSGSVLIDSTLQMIGFDHSSSSSSTPSDLNQALLLSRSGGGRAESNFHNSMLQEGVGVDEDSSSLIDGFKPMSQDFSLDQLGSSSSSGFPITSSSSAANSYGFPSTLLQSIFDSEFLLATQILSSSCLRPSAVSLPKQLQPGGGGGGGGGLHFPNNINTPFWNTPAATALNHGNSIRSSNGLFSSSQSQYTAPASSALVHEHKPNSHNFTPKGNTNEDVQDSNSVVKKSGSSMSSCEPVFKRARIETPSPLPTFKVRKEKLGDRITALQQLVSPFGKTDTASVLHEAIEYIKFLHEQVSVLSTPYMKNGAPMQHQQGSDHKMKEAEGAKHDLKSRGLCLVPISSTFPVANETTDFWTPTFGATFR